jgi:hypothetical protein
MKPLQTAVLRPSLFLAVATLLPIGTGVVRAATTYPDLILSDHPVVYYRLEETSGSTAADSSGHGFDGAIVNDATATFPKLGQPGIDTNSMLFSGGADNVTIPYDPLLSPTNGDGVTGAPFSAECWAQATTGSPADYDSPLAMSGAYTAASGPYPSGSGWNFYQTVAPISWALYMRGGSVYTFSGPSITLLRWYHLAVTWDGTNGIFYVNGVQQGAPQAMNYKAVDPIAGYAGSIGSGPQTGHGAFAGGVDEVAFYTNALTAAQIEAHYELGTNSFRVAPVAPDFVSAPASTTNYSGTTVTFSAVVSGTQPVSYQWKRGGTAILGQTNSSYSFICSYPADDGATFSLMVTNSVGQKTSPDATLTVLTNLNILHDPYGPITRNTGSKAAFRVAANGALPIRYQWFKGTTSIPGATNETLWLNNVQAGDADSYHAHVTGPFGAADTAEAALAVQPRPVNVPITGYAKVVVADDPVAYWRLDQTDATTPAVDAVGSFDGAYDNSLGAIAFGVPPGIPHETDPAIDLSDTNTATTGQGGVVRIPYYLELNPYGPWTYETWVRPDSNDTHGNFRTLLSSMYNFNFSTAVYGWLIYQHAASAWTLVTFNGTGGSSFFGSDFGHIPLIPGSWYHLVLTDDGTTIQLYVNGVAGSARTSAAGLIPNGINGDPTLNASPVVLGQRSDGAFFGFSGAVDDTAVYNYALSPQQIQNHLANSTRLGIAHVNNDIVLSWTVGALQAAPTVSGVYTNVPNATSPYTNAITGSEKFFRLLLQ